MESRISCWWTECLIVMAFLKSLYPQRWIRKNQKFFHLCQLADISKTTDVVFNVEVHRFWNKRARIVVGFTSLITVRISCSLLLENYMINEESNLFFLFESWNFVKCKTSSSKRLMISCHHLFVLAGGRIELLGNALKTYLFKWREQYNKKTASFFLSAVIFSVPWLQILLLFLLPSMLFLKSLILPLTFLNFFYQCCHFQIFSFEIINVRTSNVFCLQKFFSLLSLA